MVVRVSRALASMLFAGLLGSCDDAETVDVGADAGDARAEEAEDAELAADDADVSDDADVPDASADDADIDAGAADKCDGLEEPFDREGERGIVVARFVTIEPALTYKGHYDWTLELREPSGDAIGDAELEAEADMPSHGHGTMPITLQHEPDSPRYELGDVNLFMAGKWELSVVVRTSAGEDRVVFRACPREPPDTGDAGEDAGAPSGRH